MTEGTFKFEEAVKYLPAGLAEADLRDMYADLARLDQGALRFFSRDEFDFPLQGDAYDGVPYVNVDVDPASVRSTRAMLLSNTCDMSADNRRAEPARVIVAPLIRVARLRQVALEEGVSAVAFEAKLTAMRQHRVSNALLLPAGKGIAEESVVFFDRLQSMQIARFHDATPVKLATLSNQAFWLLTVKISIHFSRLQEGVNRQAA